MGMLFITAVYLVVLPGNENIFTTDKAVIVWYITWLRIYLTALKTIRAAYLLGCFIIEKT